MVFTHVRVCIRCLKINLSRHLPLDHFAKYKSEPSRNTPPPPTCSIVRPNLPERRATSGAQIASEPTTPEQDFVYVQSSRILRQQTGARAMVCDRRGGFLNSMSTLPLPSATTLFLGERFSFKLLGVERKKGLIRFLVVAFHDARKKKHTTDAFYLWTSDPVDSRNDQRRNKLRRRRGWFPRGEAK